MEYIILGAAVVAALIAFSLVVWVLKLRRVVPNNVVHAVQYRKKTVSYGAGQEGGNVYYAWPAWIPVFGTSIIVMQMNNFKVDLLAYEAYDIGRLPFVLDATAFFRVEDSNKAAQRVASFDEMKQQLKDVMSGAVRHVLSNAKLEEILGARAELSATFTASVQEQVKEWGVTTVKAIEFMDIRDTKDSQVIHNMMEKEKSRIDMESRTAVAANKQIARTKEIEAQRQIDLSDQEAKQQVGIRTAEKDKAVGLSQEQSKQEVAQQAAITAEKNMAVKRVEETKRAEIDKDVQVTKAQADKEKTVIAAEARLQETIKSAEGIQAEGAAKGAAEQAILMAPVNAQIELANKVGENKGYQDYLIRLEGVKVGGEVGKSMAEAIKAAKIQIISNGGTSQGQIMDGVAGIGDMFSSKGGTGLTGMLAALSQTDEGKALIGRVVGGVATGAAIAAATADAPATAPETPAAPKVAPEDEYAHGVPHPDDLPPTSPYKKKHRGSGAY